MTMFPPSISGLHHITAIAGDPQSNINFYAGVLGLRLVKRTVNFDDATAYHLYYGDEHGSPGSIITFFYWPRPGVRGHAGTGQISAIVLSAPANSLDFWQARFTAHGIPAARRTRFGETILSLDDPDGIPIEITAVNDDPRINTWTGSGIPTAYALRGLHTVPLSVRDARPTEQLLVNEMGFRPVKREGNRTRFLAGLGTGSGSYADIIDSPSEAAGTSGTGTIHHIAWRVPDDTSEQHAQIRLRKAGHGVSAVLDRTYFRSIYYRERGGILFEIATDTPGFAIDEKPAELGTALKLPLQFEHARDLIAKSLPPITIPGHAHTVLAK